MVANDAMREEVSERAGHRCEYCHYPSEVTSGPFHLEHIVPKSTGGATTPENLALACPNCNQHKYNKQEAVDPVTQEIVRLFNPRLDHWEEHFRLNRETGEIEGLTIIGRATVAALKMNLPQPVKARCHLIRWQVL